MPRYVDADELISWSKVGDKDIPLNNEYDGSAFRQIEILGHVESMPTADVVDRKTGKWLPYEFGNERWHKCSVCGVADEYINEKGLEACRNFCPNCGAQMEE